MASELKFGSNPMAWFTDPPGDTAVAGDEPRKVVFREEDEAWLAGLRGIVVGREVDVPQVVEMDSCSTALVRDVPRKKVCVASWRWDLSGSSRSSKNAAVALKAAARRGFSLVLVDAVSLDQSRPDVMAEVEKFSRLYSVLPVVTSYKIPTGGSVAFDEIVRPWIFIEFSQYYHSMRVRDMVENVDKWTYNDASSVANLMAEVLGYYGPYGLDSDASVGTGAMQYIDAEKLAKVVHPDASLGDLFQSPPMIVGSWACTVVRSILGDFAIATRPADAVVIIMLDVSNRHCVFPRCLLEGWRNPEFLTCGDGSRQPRLTSNPLGVVAGLAILRQMATGETLAIYQRINTNAYQRILATGVGGAFHREILDLHQGHQQRIPYGQAVRRTWHAAHFNLVQVVFRGVDVREDGGSSGGGTHLALFVERPDAKAPLSPEGCVEALFAMAYEPSYQLTLGESIILEGDVVRKLSKYVINASNAASFRALRWASRIHAALWGVFRRMSKDAIMNLPMRERTAIADAAHKLPANFFKWTP